MSRREESRTGRSAAVIIEDGRVALIERVRAGQTYFVFPGGGIEAGETAEEACVREIHEELGLEVRLGPLAAVVEFKGGEQLYYLARIVGGEFGTGEGEELTADPDSEAGSYRPVWVDLTGLGDHDVRPGALAEALQSHSLSGKEVLRVKE
jgi:8-oxo-dGTP diphosphatase